jgi:hypothetical protein
MIHGDEQSWVLCVESSETVAHPHLEVEADGGAALEDSCAAFREGRPRHRVDQHPSIGKG